MLSSKSMHSTTPSVCHSPTDVAVHYSIVVIPAVGLSQPSDWVDSSGSPWLKRLVDEVVPTAKVWGHVYKDDQRGSLAQRLIAEGSHLLQVLRDHCTDTEVCERSKYPAKTLVAEHLAARKEASRFHLPWHRRICAQISEFES